MLRKILALAPEKIFCANEGKHSVISLAISRRFNSGFSYLSLPEVHKLQTSGRTLHGPCVSPVVLDRHLSEQVGLFHG